MKKRPAPAPLVLRRIIGAMTLGVSTLSGSYSAACARSQEADAVNQPTGVSRPEALQPSRRLNLSEPLALPISIGEDLTWVVTTTTNRVGHLRAGSVVWWAAIEASLVAAPALMVAPSAVFLLLRDGTLEIRQQSDGLVKYRRRLPLSDCGSRAIVSALRDGTIAISCGLRIARVDATGRCLSAITFAAENQPNQVLSDLIVTANGTWHRLNRWRSPTPLLRASAEPVMVAVAEDTTTVRALLSNSDIIRFEASSLGTASFEAARSRDGRSRIVAIAATSQGRWLTLDTEGVIVHHDATGSRPVGAIGPSPISEPEDWTGQNRPNLLGLTADRIGVGWPRGPVYVVGVSGARALESSTCSTRRQLSKTHDGTLVVACANGQIAVYLPSTR